MLHTIIQQSIRVASSSPSAAAAYSMFGLMIVLFLVISIVVTSLHVAARKKFYWYGLLSLVMQNVGAVSYFIGDNIIQLTIFYNGNLNAAQISGTIFIGMALVIFLLVPQISHVLREKIDKPKAGKDEKFDDQHWCLAIDLITVILKIDVLYSALIAMIESSQDMCSETSITLSALLVTMCIILGWLYMAVIWYVLVSDDNPPIDYRPLAMTALVVVIGVCFFLHILMDNDLPVGCGFGCSNFELVGNVSVPVMNCNGTDFGPCCDQHAESSVRLSLTLINMIVLTFLSLLFASAYLTQRFKNLPDCTCVVETSEEERSGTTSESYGLHRVLTKFSKLIVNS